MTELTTRYLEVPQLPDDFDLSNTEELNKVLKSDYLRAFVHKDILYRLEEVRGAESITNSKYEAKKISKGDLLKAGVLMPKDFRVEVVSSEKEKGLAQELATVKDNNERLRNVIDDLKQTRFAEKFVLKAIAAANGHDL